MKRIHPILLAFVLIGAVSCQKEVDYVDLDDDNPTNPSDQSFLGEWRFVKLAATTENDSEIQESGITTRMVSVMSFVSTNEAGTIKISESDITTSGVKYSATTDVTTTMYIGGIKVDEFSMPFTYDAPESSASGTYKKVSADSIYMNSGIMNFEVDGQSMPSIPTGVKISWLTDTLVMTVKTKLEQNESTGGVPIKSVIKVDYKAKYVKK